MASKKTALGSRWASVMEVGERVRQARENRAHQAALVGRPEDSVRRRRRDVEHSLSDLPPAQRLDIVGRAVSKHRGELRLSTAEERGKHTEAAQRAMADAAAVCAHYGSAMQMLARESLGSDRRSRIAQQIAASGPAELSALADFAAATKDAELAAALCARNSALKLADRPFSSQELADAIKGDEHRQVTAAPAEIERLATQVAQEDAAFERGRAKPTDRLTIALMQREAAEATQTQEA